MGEGRQIQGADPERAWFFGLFQSVLLLRPAFFTGLITFNDVVGDNCASSSSLLKFADRAVSHAVVWGH